MQDNFNYDKLLSGASLYMKSDSDGSKDKEKGALPLGIKSTVQGIKHFTNWDDIATSIDKKNSLRFEDSQPNSLFFSMPNRRSDGTRTIYDDNGYFFNVPAPSINTNLSFIDSWEANDISILDNLAIVAYQDYTDVNREDFEFGTMNLKQPVYVTEEVFYDGSSSNYQDVGGIVLSSTLLPYSHLISGKDRVTDRYRENIAANPEDTNGIFCLDNSFASFDNCVLKVEFTGKIDGRTNSGGNDEQYFAKKTLYFTYGGATSNNLFGISDSFRDTVYDNDSGFRYTDNVTKDLADMNDGDFAGYFSLVTTRDTTDNNFVNPPFTERSLYGNYDDKVVNLQLDLKFDPNNWSNYNTNLEYYLQFAREANQQAISVQTVDIEAKVTLMKFTPVRKCGKIDIYQKKRGVIGAVKDQNTIISPEHKLKTNDIIDISSVLFDGEQTGAVDIHPLNGKKFVKVIDENEFYVYEDQYFENPTSLENIKYRVQTFIGKLLWPGVTWVCVGNSFGDDAQSWDYYKTLFSPTGRNGYLSRKNTDISYSGRNSNGDSATPLPESATFITDERPNKVAFSPSRDNTKLNNLSGHSLFLDFTRPGSSLLSPETRKTIGKNIESLESNIPVAPLGRSTFGIVNKGPQDFYPFYCSGEEDSTAQTSNAYANAYTGNRFGCSIDLKFSHVSGSSKIFNLIVGERGSDISVDLFGASSESEYAIDGNIPYFDKNPDDPTIYNTFRQRIIPDNLPNGKVHIFNITIDLYGNISDISHKNTIYGDGSSINSAAGLESHPWENWIGQLYGFKWRNKEYLNGNIKYLMYSSFIFNTFQAPYGNQPGVFPLSITYDDREAPFGETMINNSSLYWDRAAISNWRVGDVYDYFKNEDGASELLRNLTASERKLLPTTGQNGENSSRFGYSGTGTSITSYGRIDRFDLTRNGENSQWYVLPWVDSFGKSVALGDRNNDGTCLIFGGVTTRSNIDFEKINDLELFVGGRTNNLKRPLLSSQTYNNYTIVENKTESEIGQISCVVVDSDYKCTKFIEINSGGSVDSSRTPDVDQTIPITGDLTFSPTIKTLRVGHRAGKGIDNATLSSYWSANKIIYKDGHLIWVDQIFGSKKATLNFLSHITNNNSFLPKSTLDREFIFTDGQSNSCDGFGLDLRFDGGFLVTNCLTSVNDFGQNISGVVANFESVSAYDALMVYRLSGDRFDSVQQISPTLNKNDNRYSEKLFIEYETSLLPINNISYGNNADNSLTWNIRLYGKYDIVNDKILLKDPIEYILFGRDYSYDRILSDNQVPSQQSINIEPYFQYSEIYENDTIYYDYSNKDMFFVEDSSYWTKNANNQLYNRINRTKTPVFFISLPNLSNGYYGDINIIVNKNVFGSGRFLAVTTELDSGDSIGRAIGYSSLLPKLVMYKKDPRSTIIPNGPAANGSNSNITPYTDGIYTWNNSSTIQLLNVSPYQKLTPCIPPLFRGGAHDLFYYGQRIDSKPTIMPQENLGTDYEYYDFLTQYYGGNVNLGELFDLTYNQLGNTNKGIISWVAPDNYYYEQEFNDVTPYASLFSSFTTVGDGSYLISIPHSVWKDYIVDDRLIKNPSQNRPFYGAFDRIKHGTLDQPESDSFNDVSGTWDYNYDDENRPSYFAENENSSKTLIIGLVFSGAQSVDISTNSIVADQSSVMSQYLRMMNRYRGTKRERYDSKYSYSPVISTKENSDTNLNFAERKEIITMYSVSRINGLDFSVDINTAPKREFNTKFHKIAYYEYNNSAYSEVQKNIIDFNTSKIDRYAFGKYSFTPLPIGLSEDLASTNGRLGVSKNPIIRIGKSASSSDVPSKQKGEFVKSNHVLTSDSILPFFDSQIGVNTNYYVDDKGDQIYYQLLPTGDTLGFANFASRNLLGGFDISEPEYLSLSISSIPSEKSNINLYIKSMFSSGNMPLYSSGIAWEDSDITLWTGFGVDDNSIDLVVKSPDIENYTSLFIEEVKPSGDISLQVSGPDATGNIPLSFAPPGTGNIPLNIRGPFGVNNDADLTTRGKSKFFGRESLYTDGVYGTGILFDLHIGGLDTASGGLPLLMNIPQSGNTPLFIFAPYSDDTDTTLSMRGKGYGVFDTTLFIGTQYDISSKNINLAIKDTQRYLTDGTTLYLDGTVGYANSLISRKGDSNIIRNRDIVDITESSESPVSLTFDSTTSVSNSLTRRNVKDSYYTDKIKKLGSPNNIYYGSQRRNNFRKNPAFITQQLDTSNNKGRAFYYDGNLLNTTLNSVIKRDAYDANGKELAIAYCNNKSIEIDIYNIVENQYTDFASKICLGPVYEVPSTDSSLDLNYAINGINELPFGDSFVGIRRSLKEYFTATDYENNDIQEDCQVVVNDLKLSRLGHCAISITCKVDYSTVGFSETKIFDIIVVFHVNEVKAGTSNVSGYSGLPTYYVENYGFKIYPRSGSGYDIHSAAYSLSFDNEDLYFDRRLGNFGQVWKLTSISGHNTDSLVIDFNSHPDAQNYVDGNNAFYISPEHRKAAFGVPIKIFDDHSVGGGKVMFIGAHLFDPYVFNSLSAPHIPNAVGAVYVYKKASDNAAWSYFGAMYGQGNTSNDMPAAVIDYTGSGFGEERYGLFGYDFDYYEGRLTVSEPGGYGDDKLNLSRVYIYNITSNDIHLIRTLLASNVDSPYPEPDPSDDNFGSHVVMLDRENPISLSEQIFVSTFNNTLAYEDSSVTTLQEAKTNLSNETRFYETSQIENLNQDLVTRAEDVYSIRKLNFGNGKYKIGAIRNFNISTTTPYSSDPNYNFDLEKLFILEANKSPLSLFISGPIDLIGSTNLTIGGLGFVDNNSDLSIYGNAPFNSGMTLNIREQRENNNISLHIESLKENAMPLYLSGSVVPVNSNTSLVISPIPNIMGDMRMYTSGIGVGINQFNMKIAGSLQKNAVNFFDMYIGQDIDSDSNISLYMNAGGSSTFGSILSQGNETLSISGRSENIFDTQTNNTFYIAGPDSQLEDFNSTLYITTDIPDVGVGGGYSNSGNMTHSISGNNDLGIFTDADKFTSLYLGGAFGLNQDTTLFIERPTTNIATLSIKNQNPSGIIPVAISGAYLQDGNISLIISPPTEKSISIFTRGYIE